MNRYILTVLFTFACLCDIGAQTNNDTLSVKRDSLSWRQTITNSIDSLLNDEILTTSQLGLMVYDLTSDTILYAYNEKQMMRPASTQKIITAVAGIDRLGGSHQFKTELRYTGEIKAGVLEGDLYCVGGFDPNFNTDDMHAFVESLSRAGIDTIRGCIYADKSMKDSLKWGKGWCWDDDNPILSPLVYARKDIFMEVFIERLRENNVVVLSDNELISGIVKNGVLPINSKLLCRRFHTMDQILMRMMKDSNNLYAEAMFYNLAAITKVKGASAKEASDIIKQVVKRAGGTREECHIADGSGLSLYNYATVNVLVRLLRYAYINSNIYLHLYPSLPDAGVDGTLKSRMQEQHTRGNVRAKTGTLTAISSLAGYLSASNGHVLAFAIINQGITSARAARNFQDKLCMILSLAK